MSGSRQVRVEILGDAKSVRQAFGDAGGAAEGFASKVGGIGKVVGAAAVGVGAVFAGVGIAGIKMASDAATAQGKLQASLGITAEQADALGGVAEQVFAGAWGDSVASVTEDVGIMRRNLGDMSADAIKGLTEAALTIEDVFGASVEETSKVVSTLTKNFDGLSESDAFDLITVGFQKGGDRAEDLLDTMNEYAPQFKAMGFEADQMLGILIAGSEAGAFNLDKVGDAVKEFNLRAKDGSTSTADAFEAIGLSADQMGSAIAEGGEKGEQAFLATIAALSAIEDPMERNKQGVALFGSAWEDLEADVVTAMANGAEGIEGFEGATKKAGDAAYNNLGTAFETLKRTGMVLLSTAMEPLLAKIMLFAAFVTANMPQIQAVMQTVFSTVSVAAQFLIDKLSGPLSTAFTLIRDGVLTFIAAISGNWSDNENIHGFHRVIGNIALVIREQVIPAVQTFAAFVTDTLWPILQRGLEVVGSLVSAFNEGGLGGVFQRLGEIVATVAPIVLEKLLGLVTTVGDWVVNTGIPFLAEKLAGWADAFGGWVVAAVPPLLEKMAELLEALGAWIADTGLPLLLQKLGEWGQALIDWIGPRIVPMLTALGELLLAIGTWITTEALPAIASKLWEWGQQFVAWVGPQIGPLLSELGSLLSSLGSWITDTALPEIWAKVQEWGTQFVNWVGPRIVPLLSELGSLLVSVGDWIITTALPEIVNKLMDWGLAFINWIAKDALPYIVPKLWAFATAVNDWIQNDALPKIIEKLVEWGAAFLDWIADEVLPKIGSRLGEILSAILGWISDTASDVASAAADIGSSLVQGVIDGAKSMLGPLEDIVGTVGDIISKIDIPGWSPPGPAGYKMGKSWGMGWWNGINDSIAPIAGAVASVGELIGAPAQGWINQGAAAALDWANGVQDAIVNPAQGWIDAGADAALAWYNGVQQTLTPIFTGPGSGWINAGAAGVDPSTIQFTGPGSGWINQGIQNTLNPGSGSLYPDAPMGNPAYSPVFNSGGPISGPGTSMMGGGTIVNNYITLDGEEIASNVTTRIINSVPLPLAKGA